MFQYPIDFSPNYRVFADQDYKKALKENFELKEKIKKLNKSLRSYHGWATKRKNK